MPVEVRRREPRVRIVLDLLVEAGVAVREVLEGDVELRVQGVVERGRLRRVRHHRRVRRILVDDVVLRSPAAHVVREDHVRRELVPQRHPLLRERRRERDRVRLLQIAPEIGLDVHDHRLRPVHALEEETHVVPVRGHHLRVVQVREVGLRLAAALRIRLQHHVVRQHRDDVVSPRVLDVHRRERAVRVPRRPARAGVHAAGEVLVAEAERGGGAELGGASRRVRQPDLEGRRPAVRERRQLRRGGRGKQEEDEQRGEAAYAHEDSATPENMRFRLIPAVKRGAEPPMRGFRQVPAGAHDVTRFRCGSQGGSRCLRL